MINTAWSLLLLPCLFLFSQECGHGREVTICRKLRQSFPDADAWLFEYDTRFEVSLQRLVMAFEEADASIGQDHMQFIQC